MSILPNWDEIIGGVPRSGDKFRDGNNLPSSKAVLDFQVAATLPNIARYNSPQPRPTLFNTDNSLFVAIFVKI